MQFYLFCFTQEMIWRMTQYSPQSRIDVQTLYEDIKYNLDTYPTKMVKEHAIQFSHFNNWNLALTYLTQ